MKLISIVIPTMRPENVTLETFFQLNIPPGFNLEYIFIIDNPSKNLNNLTTLVKQYSNFEVKIINNKKNLGASASRNKGIENAIGDFILFIDDDCIVNSNLLSEYIKAVDKYPDHPGYIGLTNTPNPKSSFEHAIEISDMLHFFKIASSRNEFYWGITANLFIKREAIGNIRFPLDYPKKGGGEDIHFCLKIIENYYKNLNSKNDVLKIYKFKCVPTAEIIHPFWKESIRNYIRYFRWGYGDVKLHKRFPQNCFHQYPNYIEYLFILTFLTIFILILAPIMNLFLSINHIFFILFFNISFMTFWEVYCEANKLKSQNRHYFLTSLLKAVLIRQLNDCGRFIHQFPKIWKISKRWDYFCTGESIKYERKNALKKFIGFIIITSISITLLILY